MTFALEDFKFLFLSGLKHITRLVEEDAVLTSVQIGILLVSGSFFISFSKKSAADFLVFPGFKNMIRLLKDSAVSLVLCNSSLSCFSPVTPLQNSEVGILSLSFGGLIGVMVGVSHCPLHSNPVLFSLKIGLDCLEGFRYAGITCLREAYSDAVISFVDSVVSLAIIAGFMYIIRGTFCLVCVSTDMVSLSRVSLSVPRFWNYQY